MVWTPCQAKPRGLSVLNGHDGPQALRFEFFEPIKLFTGNLNEMAIKRFLELKMSLVRIWDLNTIYREKAGIMTTYKSYMSRKVVLSCIISRS